MPEGTARLLVASGPALAGAFSSILEAAGAAPRAGSATDRFVGCLALLLFCFILYRAIKTNFRAGSVAATHPGSETILPPGTKTLQIGPYTAIAILGKGGMGTVFKAVDSGGQIVAVKMIGGRGTDRRARETKSIALG
jgi:Mn2+/Fe2+ NRAMP family transporter